MNAATKLPDVYELLTLNGPFRCRCGAKVEHPGICDDCDAKWTSSDFEALMRPARMSIPPDFRASFDDLRKTWTGVGEANLRRFASVPTPLPKGVALVGKAGCGKTSIACAYLRRIHDWANQKRPHAGVERARLAFFVSATELEAQASQDRQRNERDGEADYVRRAFKASVLVLDNVEPGKSNGIVGRVCEARWNAGKPTIITTWMDEGEFAKHYGGGYARRAYFCTVQLEKGDQ